MNRQRNTLAPEALIRRRWLVFLLILRLGEQQSGRDYACSPSFFGLSWHIVATERYSCGGDAKTWKIGEGPAFPLTTKRFSAQYFSAKRAISSREGAVVSCFLAAGLRRLTVPLGASALFVGIGISFMCSSSLA
jgi:hypothetical protein